MTDLREAAYTALNVLDDWVYDPQCQKQIDQAVNTLRAALAQPEPEPQETIAKWIKTNTEHREWYICPKCSYQAPRFKDKWQGLTDGEYEAMAEKYVTNCYFDTLKYARAIEAKLREKNG
jgi:hypothetical protein